MALGVLYIWTGLAVSYWVLMPPSVFVTALAFLVYICARTVQAMGTRPAAAPPRPARA
jgi:hypothetical protein